MNNEKNSLQLKNNELFSKYKNLLKEKKQEELINTKLLNEKKHSNKQIEKSEKEKSSLENSLHILSFEKQQLKTTNTKLDHLNRELNENEKNLARENNKLKEEKQQLFETISTLQNENKRMQIKLNEINNAKESLQKVISDLQIYNKQVLSEKNKTEILLKKALMEKQQVETSVHIFQSKNHLLIDQLKEIKTQYNNLEYLNAQSSNERKIFQQKIEIISKKNIENESIKIEKESFEKDNIKIKQKIEKISSLFKVLRENFNKKEQQSIQVLTESMSPLFGCSTEKCQKIVYPSYRCNICGKNICQDCNENMIFCFHCKKGNKFSPNHDLDNLIEKELILKCLVCNKIFGMHDSEKHLESHSFSLQSIFKEIERLLEN